MTEIDHVLWAAVDLDEGVRSLHAATGLAAAAGGSHPGWGTRNALVGLGATYLEVLATDPAQGGGWLGEELRALPGPALHRWAVRTDAMDEVVARAGAAGLAMAPRAMSRTTPDGAVLRWRIAFVEGHDLGPVVPFVIDWLDTPHPATTLPVQGSLAAVEVAHPATDELAAVLEVLGVAVDVRPARTPVLAADLATPRGVVRLGGAPR